MNVRIESEWKEVLAGEFAQPYFNSLAERIRAEYSNPAIRVYPPAASIFAAFDASPFSETKVVIIGQDPYHGPGQANGLCFSVSPGIDMPPSLRNIFKEVSADTGAPMPADGDLTRWARQGVLLLNSSLTVREHQPKSHSGIGWERLTDAAVRMLATKRDNLVFILWGSDAIRKGEFIDRSRHLVLTSPHPSPLSAHRGFFGNRHFSRANEYLTAHGKTPIVW
ncbi:MAG: uracil-DNA glycosylase [Muribaculaceae bacterium]|nr:uracil-DNA glycosylase [Muribaculaceae bacterium]MDE6391931.1 uracil-DNA glycosylase [Muribaculaceae bacterium]